MNRSQELSIAVLPFVNNSPDPGMSYLSDGITEEIIHALGAIPALKVTSRTSSFYFKDKSMPIAEIAAQLGVRLLIEGSVRASSDKIRIKASLIDAGADEPLWMEGWDRPMQGIFELEDEISLLVADRIREHFGHFEFKDHLVRKQTDDLDAYKLSLKAKALFNNWNPKDVAEAISIYEQAISLDPEHTDSHVGLADSYGFMATTEHLPREVSWQKAVEHTMKARSIDPDHPGVHYQLAHMAFFTEAHFQKAFSHFRQAIAIRPSYPEAHQFMGFLYTLQDDFQKANEHLAIAASIDPLSPETLFFQAYLEYCKEDYEKALSLLEIILERNPGNVPAHFTRCYCLLQLKRFDEAISAVESLPQEMSIEDEIAGIRCLALIGKGKATMAEAILSQLISRSEFPGAFQAHSYVFLTYVWLGDPDKAFQWLDKVIPLRSSILLLSYSDPMSASLRKDGRYSEYWERLYGTSGEEHQSAEKGDLLPPEKATEYKHRLDQFMEEESAYLDPSLSLRSLAALLEVHPNQLSWILNSKVGKNFNEFINAYRIAHFKRLVKDPESARISLIGLAYESGFNSKTVFNTTFKKMEGITPKEFQKNIHS